MIYVGLLIKDKNFLSLTLTCSNQVSGVFTVCVVKCRWRATCWRWLVTAAAFALEPP